MTISLLQHLWDLILFLVIFLAPIPICLWLMSVDHGDGRTNLAHNLLTCLNCWCAIQVFTALVLGTIGQFFLVPLLLFELTTFSFGALLLWLSKTCSISSLFRIPFRLGKRLTRVEIFAIISIFLAATILLVKLVTEVIIDYDSLSYHLPTMARWYQEGRFVRLEEFSRTGEWSTDAITYYPFNWEILCTLFVMPFREDFLVALPNTIAWLIFGLSIYLLSIKVGAERFYSIVATSLVITIPLIVQHLNSLHVDLPFAAFFLASLYFAISYTQSHSFIALSSFFIAICMLLGIKLSSVGYAALPIAVFLFLEIRNVLFYKISFKNVLKQSSFAPPTIAVSILGSSFLGFYWYLKNFAEAGNPLGDVQVSLAGILIFPGTMEMATLRQTSLASLFHFTDLSHWKILILQALVRLQLPFLVLFFQLLLLPILLLSKQRLTYNRLLLGLCSLMLLGAGYLYWKTPFTGTNLLPPLPPQPLNQYVGQQARFAMPFMGLLGVVAAAIASVIRIPKYLITVIAFTSSLLGIVSSTVFDTVRISTAFKGGVGWASAILDGFRSNFSSAIGQLFEVAGSSVLDLVVYILIYAISLGLLVWAASRKHFIKKLLKSLRQVYERSNRFIVASAFIGLLLFTTWEARGEKDINRKEVYGGTYEYISNNLKSTETLGYLLSHRSYFFYGKHWDQKVLYASSHSGVLSEWISDLKQKHISAVAVGPLEEAMGWHPQEVNWLEDFGASFIPLFGQEPRKVFGQEPKKEVVIYRLQNGKGI